MMSQATDIEPSPGNNLLEPRKFLTHLMCLTVNGGHISTTPIKKNKVVNKYVHHHPFYTASRKSFTTSERRAFERDIYDYARGLGIDKAGAKLRVKKARKSCGEQNYDSEDSTLGEKEVNDTEKIVHNVNVESLETKETPVNGLKELTSVAVCQTLGSRK